MSVSDGPSARGYVGRKLSHARRRRRLRRAADRLYGGAPDPPAPFIGGATRSGTTLLRLMLDAHPELAIPSETHFVPDMISRCVDGPVDADELAALATGHPRWGDFGLDAGEYAARVRALEPLTAAEAIRAFYRLYAEGQGKARWGDKTPGYIRKTQPIQRVLPEARFIHMIRDGRDVALSLMPLNFGPSTVTEAAELWVKRVSTGRKQKRSANHYTEVTYEELIADTEATLRRVVRVPRPVLRRRDARYHERAGERLAEKARDLPKEGGRTQPAEARISSHALASEAPANRPHRSLAPRDERGRRGRVRAGRRRPARRTGLRAGFGLSPAAALRAPEWDRAGPALVAGAATCGRQVLGRQARVGDLRVRVRPGVVLAHVGAQLGPVFARRRRGCAHRARGRARSASRRVRHRRTARSGSAGAGAPG